MITRKNLAEKINNYLQHKTSLLELVDWAENAMMNGDFEDKYYNQIRDAVAKLGTSDVKNFGLLWEDFENLLTSLDYKVNIQLHEVPNNHNHT